MRVRRQHKAPTALTSLTENPVSGVYRLEFFPNGDRLKGQQNCQSSLLQNWKNSPQPRLATLLEMVRCLFCIQPISARGQKGDCR